MSTSFYVDTSFTTDAQRESPQFIERLRFSSAISPRRCNSFSTQGAKKILLPMSSVVDIPSVPGELFAKFQTSFYSDPVDAVFKAIGVE